MTITRRAFLTTTGAGLGLSGCGGARSLNPFSWFSQEEEVETLSAVELQAARDTRALIPEITDLTIERLPGGIIVRATGLPGEQGWHNAGFQRALQDAPGVMTFNFRARPPETATRISTVQSREIVAAVFLSDIELQGISQIRVVGARNIRVARP
jgi:hypothetical protein